jgi:hypothetical protein
LVPSLLKFNILTPVLDDNFSFGHVLIVLANVKICDLGAHEYTVKESKSASPTKCTLIKS